MSPLLTSTFFTPSTESSDSATTPARITSMSAPSSIVSPTETARDSRVLALRKSTTGANAIEKKIASENGIITSLNA